MFHCWKAKRGLKLPRNLRIVENYHLHIYSLWFIVPLLDFVFHRRTDVTYKRPRIVANGTVQQGTSVN